MENTIWVMWGLGFRVKGLGDFSWVKNRCLVEIAWFPFVMSDWVQRSSGARGNQHKPSMNM